MQVVQVGQMIGERNKMDAEEPPLQEIKNDIHASGSAGLPGWPKRSIHVRELQLEDVLYDSGCKPYLGLRYSPNLYLYDAGYVSGGER